MALSNEGLKAIIELNHELLAAQERIAKLEAAMRKITDTAPDCWEHAGNCCSDWCETCEAGAKSESSREIAKEALKP